MVLESIKYANTSTECLTATYVITNSLYLISYNVFKRNGLVDMMNMGHVEV